MKYTPDGVNLRLDIQEESSNEMEEITMENTWNQTERKRIEKNYQSIGELRKDFKQPHTRAT